MILKTLAGRPDNDPVKWMIIGKAGGLGAWLTLDALQWLAANGILTLENDSKLFLSFYAPRCWAFGLSFSCLQSLFKLDEWWRRERAARVEAGGSVKADIRSLKHREEGLKIASELAMDLIDLIIPLSMMGSLKVSPGFVGFAGTVTSVWSISNLLKNS